MPGLTDILLYIAIGVGALCLLLLIILLARPAKGGDGALKRLEEKTDKALQYADYSARTTDNLSRTTEMRLNNIETRLAEDIKYIADVNAHNLEVIRRTVDDKLTSSDGKLSESYARISDRLEKMHKSVGEMQALSESVSDIRRVFTNVKLRGTWGETQLNALLEQMLAPDQYVRSCKLDPLGNTLVDFAIRLPSVSGDTLLPVDSKFPVEEYERLCESSEKGDWAGTELARKNLERAVRVQAESIAKKYILPPATTDFAVLYLPSEALYAEVLKITGLADFLHKRRIILSGPSSAPPPSKSVRASSCAPSSSSAWNLPALQRGSTRQSASCRKRRTAWKTPPSAPTSSGGSSTASRSRTGTRHTTTAREDRHEDRKTHAGDAARRHLALL